MWFLAALCGLGLALSASVHFGTYLSLHAANGLAVLLHVGAIALVGMAVLINRFDGTAGPGGKPPSLLAGLVWILLTWRPAARLSPKGAGAP